jgi:hypothetical protein
MPQTQQLSKKQILQAQLARETEGLSEAVVVQLLSLAKLIRQEETVGRADKPLSFPQTTDSDLTQGINRDEWPDYWAEVKKAKPGDFKPRLYSTQSFIKARSEKTTFAGRYYCCHSVGA